jgi:SpoVK/Ycf46/Vps4 family AAA+-type ATPase
VFLRRMEYFRGILFLTTNRVGHIDEAFMSRVHVVLEYPPLSDNQRQKIWDGFFAKLKRECEGRIIVTLNARNYVKQDCEKLNLKLNGREIRNVLQTAIVLAEHEASKNGDGDEPVCVERGHFERVVKLCRSFTSYVDSIKNDTSEKRAKQTYLRNDGFSKQNDS